MLKNLTISRKLTLSFIVMAGAAFVAGLMIFLQLRESERAVA